MKAHHSKHATAALCWRCKNNDVQCFGVACPPCLTILHAEYDARLEANGGRLLYIPPDWDGPDLFSRSAKCMDCGGEFEYTRRKTGQPIPKRCPPCKHDYEMGWYRRKYGLIERDTEAVPVDFTNV